MAISFDETTAGTFWQRLDKISAVLVDLRTHFRTGGTYETTLKAFESAITDISVSGDVAIEGDIGKLAQPAFERFKAAAAEYGLIWKQIAQALAARHLWRDANLFGGGPGGGFITSVGSPGSTLQVSASALKPVYQEIRRQMAAASQSVQTCAPGITVTNGAGLTGTGAVVTSTKRGDGLSCELAVPESGELRCVRSGSDPGGTVNHEEFWYQASAPVDGTHPDWGETGVGSGAFTALRVIDPTASAGRGNLLVNGGMEYYPASGSTNTPTGWATDGAGTDGTDFQASSAQAFFGTKSLLFIAGTGVQTSLAQYFGSYNQTNSTSERLEASTQYAYCVRLRSTGTVTAGAMTVALANAASTTINDDLYNSSGGTAGSQNISSSIDLTAVGSGAWTTATGVFRTPSNINSGVAAVLGPKLRVRIATAITGANVYFEIAFGKMIELHPGGPWIALFAGQTPFVSGQKSATRDYFTVAITNDNGGASTAKQTYHRLCDALLDLRAADVLFPSASAETIADSVLA